MVLSIVMNNGAIAQENSQNVSSTIQTCIEVLSLDYGDNKKSGTKV